MIFLDTRPIAPQLGPHHPMSNPTKEKRDRRVKVDLAELFPQVADLAASREWSIPKAALSLIRTALKPDKSKSK